VGIKPPSSVKKLSTTFLTDKTGDSLGGVPGSLGDLMPSPPQNMLIKENYDRNNHKLPDLSLHKQVSGRYANIQT
jgi:hypothetical protein